MDLDAFCAQYEINLNPQQRSAVLRDGGETLLLAVPGSGKTTVLIARIGYLIFCRGVPAENILCITYTKAAAEEMESRFHEKFGADAGNPNFATINSLCVQILRYAKITCGVSMPALIPNTRKLLRTAMKEAKGIWMQDNTVQMVEQILTQSKNRMTSKTELEAIRCPELEGDCPGMTIAQFSALYRDYKAEHNCMDFDDQLIRAYRILRKFPQVKEYFKAQYPHISLDEAQDTSPIQFAILEMLTQGGSSFFVVGDDDQSIYGFRGASPQYILDFKTHYPGAEVLYLETNYRSGRYIVEIANQFVSWNQFRYAKTAVANSTLYGEIQLQTKFSEEQVYEAIQRTLSDSQETGETVAVLARNNFMLMPLVADLNRAGMRVNRQCSFDSYLALPLVAGIVAALTLTVHPDKFSELRKARKVLGLYLKNSKLDELEEACGARPNEPVLAVVQTLCAEDKSLVHRLQRAEVLLTALAGWKPVNAVQYLREQTEKILHLDLDKSFPLDVLELMAQREETIPAFLGMLKHCKKSKGDTNSNITLTTIHSAKGLEFDRVILLDAFQGILPQEEENEDEMADAWEALEDEPESAEEEEEARLFYVAITRAKRRVDIYLPRFFGYRVVQPSPFVQRMFEAPKRETEENGLSEENAAAVPEKPAERDLQTGGMPAPGDRIRHGIMGAGTVTAVIGDVLTVRFDSGTERSIAWCNWI